MKRLLLMLAVILVPVVAVCEVVNIGGVDYPRDPFLTPQQQRGLFLEIEKEWAQLHNKPKQNTQDKGIKNEELTVQAEGERQVNPANEQAFPGLNVEAVLTSLDMNGQVRKWILVNGNLLREGNKIGNITIEKITSEGVLVRWNGENRIIDVERGQRGLQAKEGLKTSENKKKDEESRSVVQQKLGHDAE